MRFSMGERVRLGLSWAVTAGVLAGFFALGKPLPTAGVQPNGKFTREAMYWKRADRGVKCGLCPFNCYLGEGARGKCRVRASCGGKLLTMVWGQAASLAVDPIEKKPVFHMLPGTLILSFATVGCPLRCNFCQNWSLSQVQPEELKGREITTPEVIVGYALANRIPSIAYTYSEPAVFYEYMLDTAMLAKRKGLRNVVVTSGYINPEPLEKLAPYLDVVKVDLKGLNPGFYKDEVGGRLEPVLATLKLLRAKGVLVEVVNLVVPGRNDSGEDFTRLAAWVMENMGADTPLFFSRFHPDYRLANLPSTPLETLERARALARKAGLRYVYLGNVPGGKGENTVCPWDGTLLVGREGYLIRAYNLKAGRCPSCGRTIPGIWHR